jgi:hypothetical protein
MVTGVLVPTESSSGMSTGAQPANAVCGSTLCPVIRGKPIDQDFVFASGPGADVYGPPSFRGAPGGRPEPAISSRSRDPSPNPGAQTHTLSPVPGAVPAQGNWLRDTTPKLGPPPTSGRYPSSRDPSPHPGAGIYGPRRSQTPSPIPGAASYPYSNQSRDLPSVPVPVPSTDQARGRYPHSRSPSPLPGAGTSSSPSAFPTWRNQSRDPSPIPPPRASPGRYANPRASPQAGAVPAGPGQPKTLLPDAFSRPANFMQPNPSFETRKIQDMDDFYVPMMPKVLVPRNVNHDEWIRFVQVGRLFLSAQPCGGFSLDNLSKGSYARMGWQVVIAILSSRCYGRGD